MTAIDTSSTIDDAFLSVWRQGLLEQKRIISLGDATFSVRRTAKHVSHKLILNWTAWNIAAWNKILKPNPDGQKWPAKAQRSCSFCGQADTSAWSPMES